MGTNQEYYAAEVALVDNLDPEEKVEVTALMRNDRDTESGEVTETKVGFVPIFPGLATGPNFQLGNGTFAGYVVVRRSNVDSRNRMVDVVDPASPDVVGMAMGGYMATQWNSDELQGLKRSLVASRMTRDLLDRWDRLSADELDLIPILQEAEAEVLSGNPIDKHKQTLDERLERRDGAKDVTGRDNPVATKHKQEADERLLRQRLRKNIRAGKSLDRKLAALLGEVDGHLAVGERLGAFFDSHETVEEALDEWHDLFMSVRYQPWVTVVGDAQGLVNLSQKPEPLVLQNARQVMPLFASVEEIMRAIRPLGSLSDAKATADADRYCEIFMPLVGELADQLADTPMWGQYGRWRQRLTRLTTRIRMALGSGNVPKAARLARLFRNEFFCRVSDPTWCTGVPVGHTLYALADWLNPKGDLAQQPDDPWEGIVGQSRG
ncbi:MAG TPA: hypothetical protein VLF69_01465 [Candidatus Saccharimonadales bacterium]|nr:hypothetical protein [Candidatus Saccharimonadales bacterium]